MGEAVDMSKSEDESAVVVTGELFTNHECTVRGVEGMESVSKSLEKK